MGNEGGDAGNQDGNDGNAGNQGETREIRVGMMGMWRVRVSAFQKAHFQKNVWITCVIIVSILKNKNKSNSGNRNGLLIERTLPGNPELCHDLLSQISI